MKYLVIDACFAGTGIRDKYEGYLSPEDLELNPILQSEIREWLTKYENEHYIGFKNVDIIDNLDIEGVEIAKKIKQELINSKVQYFSAARMTLQII